MSQKIPVDGIEWVRDTEEGQTNLNLIKFRKDFIEKYNEDSDEEYFLEVDNHYPENSYNSFNGLSLLSERLKIEKIRKPVANFHDEKQNVIHIKNLKQANQ